MKTWRVICILMECLTALRQELGSASAPQRIATISPCRKHPAERTCCMNLRTLTRSSHLEQRLLKPHMLALFLGLCGISKEAVCTEGLARYCSAYGYGTATERAEILPQIERELEAGDMSRIISFFRHFLEEGFEAFAAELYGWIQEARHKTSEDAEQSAIADNEESLHYLDKDKRDLLRIFRVFLEEVAQGSCTPFERRLRAEILEREVLSAEAEQVAGSMYDALLPNEVEAWNKKLHESDLDAYWLPA